MRVIIVAATMSVTGSPTAAESSCSRASCSADLGITVSARPGSNSMRRVASPGGTRLSSSTSQRVASAPSSCRQRSWPPPRRGWTAKVDRATTRGRELRDTDTLRRGGGGVSSVATADSQDTARARSRADAPIRRAPAGSAQSPWIASASAPASGGTSRPVTPSTTNSVGPPESSQVITGLAHAIASRVMSPRSSSRGRKGTASESA